MNDFLKLYEEIFNSENEVKICGRDKCKNLIKLASEINSNVDFGNIDTGFMNIKNIILLKENLDKL